MVHREKKKRAKIALLESNFENRLSFLEESCFFSFIGLIMFGEKDSSTSEKRTVFQKVDDFISFRAYVSIYQ